MSQPEPVFKISTTNEKSFVIDPLLSSGSAGLCDLLIILENNRAQISLIERKTLRLVAIEIIQPNIEINTTAYFDQLKSKSQLINKFPFEKVRLCVVSNSYTFVPEALFKSGDEYKFYRINFSSDIHSVVLAEHVSKYHLYSVFGVNQETVQLINQYFPDCKLYHSSQVILNNCFLSTRADSGKLMWLQVRNHAIDITVTDGKKLILMNSFVFQTIEDILYYSLFVCEQLNINPEQMKLMLSGNIERSSAIYKLLDKYFSSMNYFEELPGQNRTEAMEEISLTSFPLLYGFSLCE